MHFRAFLPALIGALACVTAWAEGPANIGGLSDRLEKVECKGAHVMKLKAFLKLGETVCTEAQSSSELFSCLKGELPKVAEHKANAFLEIESVPHDVLFRVSITDGRSEVLQSLRKGIHGDTETGITLSFLRAGIEGEDPYTLDLAELSADGSHSPAAVVPVRRKILPDLVYVFLMGCELRWIRKDQ